MTRCTCPGPGEWHNTGCPVGDAPARLKGKAQASIAHRIRAVVTQMGYADSPLDRLYLSNRLVDLAKEVEALPSPEPPCLHCSTCERMMT